MCFGAVCVLFAVCTVVVVSIGLTSFMQGARVSPIIPQLRVVTTVGHVKTAQRHKVTPPPCQRIACSDTIGVNMFVKPL